MKDNMSESDNVAELLFFDTFSHEDTDLNLDLVQFPKPVYITQVRIIPLGARVQADFPGGVRLGATNPSKFDIDFFVNDLGMPGAATFENLGTLQYNQNDCIHLECSHEKIPTDGLVLRGWYSTITLAVYGILSNSLNNEPIASPPPPSESADGDGEVCNLNNSGKSRRNSTLQDEEEHLKNEWKDPTDVGHAHKTHINELERDDSTEYAHTRDHYHYSSEDRDRRLRKSSHSSERTANSSRNRTHSDNERDYMRHSGSGKSYGNYSFESGREREKSTRDWSPEYGRRGTRRKYSEHSSRSDAEETSKWPRTPPVSVDSPMRPISPDHIMDYADMDDGTQTPKYKTRKYSGENITETHNRSLRENADEEDALSTPGITAEQFEPILSDEEVLGDDDLQNTVENENAINEYELELEAEAAAMEPALVFYDPFKMSLKRLEKTFEFQYNKDLQNLQQLYKKYEKCITCCESFLSETELTAEQREDFVYFGEQIINQLIALSMNYKRRNHVLQQFFTLDNGKYLQQTCKVLQILLSFSAACLQQQPAFKIRHMKVGARLVELLGSNKQLLQYCLEQQGFDPFAAVFELFHQPYMALSIKLMLLRAIYALLDSQYAQKYFISGKVNGYQLLITALQQARLTPIKYALQSIIRKLHLKEALETMRDTCTKLFITTKTEDAKLDNEQDYQLILEASEQLLDALTVNTLNYQQPKRFLPVTRKFDIIADTTAQRNYSHALQTFCQETCLAESLLLLCSNARDLPVNVLQHVCKLLEALLQQTLGVDYFVDDCFETTQLLVTILLQNKEQIEDTTESPSIKKENVKEETTESSVKKEEDLEGDETPVISEPVVTPTVRLPVYDRLQLIGLELAYKVQTRYDLDAITYYANLAQDAYLNANDLAAHLHALYSQTCNALARMHTVQILGLPHNVQLFLDIISREQNLQTKRQQSSPGAKYKSPVLSYAVDMLDCCVRYCEQLDYLIIFNERILQLAKYHDNFEPSVSAVLQEMSVYLKPLETFSITNFEEITPLVDIITRSLDYINTFPGELIMALRILRQLCLSESKCTDTKVLKPLYVALQFYGADGLQLLLQILERICNYFEQPGLHTPVLACMQGLHCVQIVFTTLQLLRLLLTEAIRTRDVLFKDLTAIEQLMRTYYLLHYFPARSQVTQQIELGKQEIIKIFLAYTQTLEAQDEESLHKSLWTQMLRELFTHISEPATFIPGLLVLAELLPLPLPLALPANCKLTEAQANRLITQRKWWSAHLHPLSLQIAQLIETMATTSFPQLSDLLIRVCLQLADLGPNMSLLISKTLAELLWTEWQNSNATPNALLARLLQLFSRLTAYASLKCSALSILNGKLMDLFAAILAQRQEQPDIITYKCQAYVHRIIESFLDSEISLISTQSSTSPELNLASALPPKECIPRIVEAIVNNLLSITDVTHEVSALGVRNVVILTEHDITFFHLSQLLKQKSKEFQEWIEKIVSLNESDTYNSNIESLMLLLRSLTYIEENSNQDATLPPRLLLITPNELVSLISENKTTALVLLQRMKRIFEQHKDEADDLLLQDINKLIEQVETLSNTNDVTMPETQEEAIAPTLPQSESLVTQYAGRPIYTQFDTQTSAVQLNANYWLQPMCIDTLFGEDFVNHFERTSCDLAALAAECLSEDINLSSVCKRVLHLSASPQSNRERTPTAPCFRTQRVEVEPSTGRPEKKLYVTPMRGRGFSRVQQSRGDLFRSRPPNTSRPPSLHVDDFLALETRGAQPTGPTGYNKIPPMLRGARVGRNRGSRISAAVAFRKSKMMRTSSPSSWNDPNYRGVVGEQHFGGDPHYNSSPFGRARGRGMRARSYLR